MEGGRCLFLFSFPFFSLLLHDGLQGAEQHIMGQKKAILRYHSEMKICRRGRHPSLTAQGEGCQMQPYPNNS